MSNIHVEKLPNGTFNLTITDDAGATHKVKLDSLYEDAGTQTTTLPAGTGRVKTLVSQTLGFASFTDGTSTSGYIDFSTQLPANCLVLGWESVVATGFTGDTTATVKVGISGGVANYSAITSASCLAAGTVQAASVAATSHVAAATTPRVTVTGGSDFGAIVAGSMTVTVFYLDLSA
jgi:hypothetical protein